MTATIKVLFCNSYGGFELSDTVHDLYNDRFPERKLGRANYDEELIKIVEEVGYNLSSTKYCNVKITEITYDTRIPLKYVRIGIVIDEYDGLESVYISEKGILYYMIEKKAFQTMEEMYEMMDILKKIECKTLPDPLNGSNKINETGGGRRGRAVRRGQR